MAHDDIVYLGDSVYSVFDGYTLTIHLNNGLGAHSHIYLDPSTIRALIAEAKKRGIVL